MDDTDVLAALKEWNRIARLEFDELIASTSVKKPGP
jgi:hypothetical protein